MADPTSTNPSANQGLASPELLRRELPRLYAFAYHMSCSREEALASVRQLVADVRARGGANDLGLSPSDALLAILARTIEEALGRKSEHSFEGLDEVLRSDITRPIDLRAGALAGDPVNLHTMLWELKRTCLTATLSCLPPGVRVSFVLTDLLGYGPVEAADLLGIKESAYRVRLTRARKRVEDYLTPRCTHVDGQNPCTCTGRLLIAMEANFVKMPPHRADIPHEPHDADGPRRDMGSLYRSLPVVALLDEQLAAVLA